MTPERPAHGLTRLARRVRVLAQACSSRAMSPLFSRLGKLRDCARQSRGWPRAC